MASVVFYFEVHQPHRLRRYSVFDSDPYYFDDAKNGEVCRKVADKCYRPTTRLILDMVKRHKGNFRVSYAITGTVLEQWQQFCPDVIGIFQELAKTGCCEFVGETYYHSLSALYSRTEFNEQVELHTRRIQSLFNQTPQVFRNTELIYNNDLAWHVSQMKGKDGKPRWKGMICEGVDRLLGSRSPNYVYTPPGEAHRPRRQALRRPLQELPVERRHRVPLQQPGLERVAPLCREVRPVGQQHQRRRLPLQPLHGLRDLRRAPVGRHRHLPVPRACFPRRHLRHSSTRRHHQNHFITPSMAFDQFPPVGEYDVPRLHLLGRHRARPLRLALQRHAVERPRRDVLRPREAHQRPLARAWTPSAKTARRQRGAHLAANILTDAPPRPLLPTDWRKLTTSDHFYYMCTKYFADGDVHKYFSPYDSPYDAYITYLNVLDNLRGGAGGRRGGGERGEATLAKRPGGPSRRGGASLPLVSTLPGVLLVPDHLRRGPARHSGFARRLALRAHPRSIQP